jgi:hypothetical protein
VIRLFGAVGEARVGLRVRGWECNHHLQVVIIISSLASSLFMDFEDITPQIPHERNQDALGGYDTPPPVAVPSSDATTARQQYLLRRSISKGVDQNFFGVLIDFDSYLAPID